MVYHIWFSSSDSVSSKVVRSVLKLRQESWEIVSRPESANVWVVDGSENYNEQGLMPVFNNFSGSSLKVMYLAESGGHVPHSHWHLVELPLNASKLFEFFDRHLKDIKDEPAKMSSAQTINSQAGPKWKISSFKLDRWPNIARYGSDAHLPLTCSNLLRGYSDFDTALSWGLPQPILEQILVDAEKDGIISYNDTESITSQVYSKPPELGLFQRFMRRFV